MGDGADSMDEGYGAPGGGGGEYYGAGGGFQQPAPAPGPWGPPEGYDPRYAQMQPVPAYPVHQQPAAEYRPHAAPPPPPRRQARRKVSKGMQRMYLVQYYEMFMETPIFGDPTDPIAQQVQEEVFNFAQRRIDELLGEAPERLDLNLTPQEAAALKLLLRKMTSPEEVVDDTQATDPTDGQEPAEEEAVEASSGSSAPRAAPPQAPVPPAPVQRPVAPPAPAQAPPQPPPRPPPSPAPVPRPPQMGPRVITRPTPAQRQALEAARQAPSPRPPAPPPPAQVRPPQMMHHPMAPAPAPPPAEPTRGRRRRRGEPAAPAPRPGPPPPMRYAMPTGEGMTAVSAMKAQAQIEAGGTVLSQTFVKSNQQ